MIGVTEQLALTRERLARACREAGRAPRDVTLLAVSKRQSADRIRAAVGAGQRAFGENIVAEALAKQRELGHAGIVWHFIGTLQSNKTRDVARAFDWVQTVDRMKLVRRLAAHRPGGAEPLNVCLQVNIDAEPTKAGTMPDAVRELADAVVAAPALRLRGLMCIPRPESDPDRQRRPFRQMKSLYDELVADGYELDTLSMGMSADLEAAVAEGSTMVRIGTAIFGARDTA